MSEKIKSTAKEEGERVKRLTQDAVQSQAYLYPIKVSRIMSGTGQQLTDTNRASSTTHRIAPCGSR